MEMIFAIIGSLCNLRVEFSENQKAIASCIDGSSASVFCEHDRNADFVHAFLKRRRTVDKSTDAELVKWMGSFATDKAQVALGFRYGMRKGHQESFRES